MRNYATKTVVITGAGSGIGRALALEMAGRGAALALSDVDAAAAEQTALDCRATGARAQAWQVDVADREAVFTHASDVAQAFGAVHVVVNNAGVSLHGLVRELQHKDMQWLMDINYWGVVHGSQAFLPHLLRSGGGQIANVSSVFGLIAVPQQAAYNSAKFAVRGFTESLRQEMQLEGLPIGVSCIHPGGIRTSIVRNGRYCNPDAASDVEHIFERAARTTAERAARVIVRGLSRDRARILIGPDARVMAALPRLLGPAYGRLTTAAARRYSGATQSFGVNHAALPEQPVAESAAAPTTRRQDA